MTGDELRWQRGRLRLTQRQLADRAGVGLRTVTSWEARGSGPLPASAEARLTAIVRTADDSPPRALSDVSDLDLIAELARRLSLPRVSTTARRTSDGEDYPSEASAEGIVGTPKNETAHLATTSRRRPHRVSLQSIDGDSPERRHHR
jgi:transcriptional regulator with XRE-family HTH domain